MQNIKKYFMTLVALFAISTGAWATDPNTVVWNNETWAGWAENVTTHTVGDITITCSGNAKAYESTTSGEPLALQAGANDAITFTSNGKPFASVAITTDQELNVAGWTYNSSTWSYEWSGEPTTSVTLSGCDIEADKISFTFGTAAPAGTALKPDATRKVWTLDAMPANDIELQVEYEPTKVTMAANDKTMGTVEVSGESKVEWTADTWKDWTYSTKTYTVDDITMTSTNSAYIQEITEAGDYLHSLNFYVSQEDNNSTVTFSTTGDPFSRIEFTMIDDYKEDYLVSNRWAGNPVIMPKDNWTFSGKSAVWEGEATKSLTLQSCTTTVSKITFFKGAVPDGVTVNGDGTFTVAKTATVTLTATPAEGYKFLYWEDDQTNTNPVREVTIESGMADMTYKAVFAEPTFNVTFADDLAEPTLWTASPNADVKKGETVTVTYTGTKKVIGVKAEKKATGNIVDLSTLTEAYEAQTLDILTGTTSQLITIAAGATVTLKDATVNNQITCSGDATIILADGSTNTVTAPTGKAGIIIGPSKTLTIDAETEGTGTLTAKGGSDAAGIGTNKDETGGNIVINGGKVTATGGGRGAGIGTGNAEYNTNECGSITINGGKITATGGSQAAGIGTGVAYNRTNTCGAITINGGTVTATGSGSGAGIGTGYAVSSTNTCGDITIGTGVKSVTATKGAGSPNSIGIGYKESYGTQTCGTITIGGVVKDQSEFTGATYTYPSSN